VIGKLFITRSGYDPERGKFVKDPYLGDTPSLGACRPDIRKTVRPGDLLFAISGKVAEVPQFVMGGFEVAQKITASAAFEKFPAQRLRLRPDGQLEGNVIVDDRGGQHQLDNHQNFARRLSDYVIGRNAVALVTPAEIARGRAETLDMLRELFKRQGSKPADIISRFGCTMNEEQARRLYAWLRALKETA
jgi:hypothetical protein